MDVQNLEKNQRNKIIKELCDQGAGFRQLARITGISYGIIQRVVTDQRTLIYHSSLVIHISFSNRSLIVLQLTSNSVPLYPSLSFALSPIVVPLLSDCCSIVVRLLSDCCPINERTTDVHQTHFNRTRVGAEPWVNRG